MWRPQVSFAVFTSLNKREQSLHWKWSGTDWFILSPLIRAGLCSCFMAFWIGIHLTPVGCLESPTELVFEWGFVSLSSACNIVMCPALKCVAFIAWNWWYVHRGKAQGHVGVSEVVKPAGIVLRSSNHVVYLLCWEQSPKSNPVSLCLDMVLEGATCKSLGMIRAWTGNYVLWMLMVQVFEITSILLIWVNTRLKIVQKGVSSLQLHPRPGTCAALRHFLPRDRFSFAHGHGSSNESLFLPCQWLNGVQV